MSTTTAPVIIDPSTLSVGDEQTFLPGGDVPAGVVLLLTPGFYNLFADDGPVEVTVADDGVTVEGDLGAGWFPNGVVITFAGDRSAWRREAGF